MKTSLTKFQQKVVDRAFELCLMQPWFNGNLSYENLPDDFEIMTRGTEVCAREIVEATRNALAE